MNRRIRQDSEGEHGLAGSEPDETHEQHSRMMVHVKERESPEWFAEYDQECVSKLKDLREVEDLSPKEKRSARFHVQWETDRVEQTCCRICGDGESATNRHN